MFSESKTPISELIKGNPDKPLREPALALFAIVFNLFTIYQINEMLRQMNLWYNPSDPWGWMYISIMNMMAFTITGMALFYSVMLLLGAFLMRFIHRRVGAILVLVFSVLVLLISFMALAFGGFGLLIGTILGMAAGIMGVRGGKEITPRDVVEII
ncbi:MAG: hypothetical protein ACFFD8_06910 [Candidatus Thorarchaeota archaeon]